MFSLRKLFGGAVKVELIATTDFFEGEFIIADHYMPGIEEVIKTSFLYRVRVNGKSLPAKPSRKLFKAIVRNLRENHMLELREYRVKQSHDELIYHKSWWDDKAAEPQPEAAFRTEFKENDNFFRIASRTQ